MLDADFHAGGALFIGTQGFSLCWLHVANTSFAGSQQQVSNFLARGGEVVDSHGQTILSIIRVSNNYQHAFDFFRFQQLKFHTRPSCQRLRFYALLADAPSPLSPVGMFRATHDVVLL